MYPRPRYQVCYAAQSTPTRKSQRPLQLLYVVPTTPLHTLYRSLLATQDTLLPTSTILGVEPSELTCVESTCPLSSRPPHPLIYLEVRYCPSSFALRVEICVEPRGYGNAVGLLLTVRIAALVAITNRESLSPSQRLKLSVGTLHTEMVIYMKLLVSTVLIKLELVRLSFDVRSAWILRVVILTLDVARRAQQPSHMGINEDDGIPTFS